MSFKGYIYETTNLIDGRKYVGKRETLKGKRYSEEHKDKISLSCKGNKNAIRKPVLQYDLQGNFIRTWSCITEATNEIGIAQSHISACCKGKRNKAGGFIWRYKEEETK